jgi:hypothetical protein
MKIESLVTPSSHDYSIPIHHLLKECLRISKIHHMDSAGLGRITDFYNYKALSKLIAATATH